MSNGNKVELLTAKNVAEQLGCSEVYVYTLFNTGKLKGIKLSHRFIKFRQEDVDVLLVSKYHDSVTEGLE